MMTQQDARSKHLVTLLTSILVLAMRRWPLARPTPTATPTPTPPPETHGARRRPPHPRTAERPPPQPTPTAMMMEDTSDRYGGIPNFSTRADPPRGWDPIRSGSISVLQAGGVYLRHGQHDPAMPGRRYAAVCPGRRRPSGPRTPMTARSWTFTLRDNVYWHDGVKLTAAKT